MKLCGKCKTSPRRGTDSYCGECRREYNLNRYHTIRSFYIEKLGGKCQVCGTEEGLEFDHIDKTTKTFDIGKLLNKSKAAIEEEMKLCQLLCTKHHIEKSLENQDIGNVNHGEGLTGKKNCRCDLCNPLKQAYMKDWHLNRNRVR